MGLTAKIWLLRSAKENVYTFTYNSRYRLTYRQNTSYSFFEVKLSKIFKTLSIRTRSCNTAILRTNCQTSTFAVTNSLDREKMIFSSSNISRSLPSVIQPDSGWNPTVTCRNDVGDIMHVGKCGTWLLKFQPSAVSTANLRNKKPKYAGSVVELSQSIRRTNYNHMRLAILKLNCLYIAFSK